MQERRDQLHQIYVGCIVEGIPRDEVLDHLCVGTLFNRLGQHWSIFVACLLVLHFFDLPWLVDIQQDGTLDKFDEALGKDETS